MIDAFIKRWELSAASERANYQLNPTVIEPLRTDWESVQAAVAAAYGWEGEVLKCESAKVLKLTDDEILERLVALNKARADEEARGTVLYLRPAYQRPAATPTQAVLDVSGLQTTADSPQPSDSEPLAWPDTLADQIALVRGVIHQTAWQQTDGAKTLARHFTGVRAPTVQRLVDALAALGQVG